MKILALDSSSRAASCAILCDGVLLGESFLDCGLTHSQTLLPMVRALCQGACVTLAHMDRVAVTKGPGSFTGLRIGMAAGKAIASACDIPIAGISTLEALAFNLHGCYTGYCCAALDARRGQVYCALFELHDGAVSRICPDIACSLEELGAKLEALHTPVMLLGDGAQLCFQAMSTHLHVQMAPPHLRLQRASSTGFAALKTDTWEEAAALIPVYLRLSQAEREKANREEQR